MIFKLFVEGQEVVTDKEEYFEIVKGSVLSGDFGTINREFSTNITLPAVSKNIGIFKAHKLWGGNSNVMNGVAHFGHEAFECLVQLVAFDEKKITIYIVKASGKVNEFFRKTVGDIMEEGQHTSYVWFGGDTTPPIYYVWRDAFLSRLSQSSNYDATFIPQKKSLAATIGNTTHNGLVTSSEILNLGDNVFPYSRPGGNQIAMLFGSDVISLDAGGSRNLFMQSPENATNTTEISFDENGVITISPKLATAGGDINLLLQASAASLSGAKLEVRRNSALINSIFIPGGTDFWMSDNYGLVAGTYEFKIRVTGYEGYAIFLYNAALFINATEEQMGGDVPWGLSQIGGTLPAITMRDVLSDLALENGKYIAIDRDNKITFKDFPSIDDLNVINMENYFIRSKGTKMKASSPLKSVNNYIQYPEDETGSYSRINIKIDDNRIYAPLTPSGVLKELNHYRVSAFTPTLNLDKLQFEGNDTRLKNALSKFQIFRDTFNNVILYTVEFKNLQEVPEEIMYIPQLNGLFIAEKIIKTSKNKVVVNCYKIQKQ